jgi:hypothetical protein
LFYFKDEKPKRKNTTLSRISESSALQDFGTSPEAVKEPADTASAVTLKQSDETALRSIIKTDNVPASPQHPPSKVAFQKQSPLSRNSATIDLTQSLALSGAYSNDEETAEPLSLSTAAVFPAKQPLQSAQSMPNGNSTTSNANGGNSIGQLMFNEAMRSLSVNSAQNQQQAASLPLPPPPPAQLDPSQVFLQLFQAKSSLTDQKDQPLLIPDNANIKRSLDLLDIMPCYLVHKIGVVYLGRNQQQTSDEKSILSNSYGSLRYKNFISGLGNLIKLKDMDTRKFYSGGLETDGSLADFTFFWFDGIVQVQFHVATMMFSKEENLMHKKRHIGNDSVIIVYNESGEEYQFNMLKV